MNIDIQGALDKDENFQKGVDEYKSAEIKANLVAEEISAQIVTQIIKEQEIDGEKIITKDKNKFTITTALLAVAKSLTNLASYLYDTEEEFLTDVKKARTSVVSDVIPALLDPQPCGECENCKNGNEAECINPLVRGDYTQSRFLPILCNMLIEYDLFNKIIHMHTVGKQQSFLKKDNLCNEAFEDNSNKEEK